MANDALRRNPLEMTLYGLVAAAVVMLGWIGFQIYNVKTLETRVSREVHFLGDEENGIQALSSVIQSLRREESNTPEGKDTVSSLINALNNEFNIQFNSERPKDPGQVGNRIQENSAEYTYGKVSKNKILSMLTKLEDSKTGLTVTRLDMGKFARGADAPDRASFTAHWYSPLEKK